jgi:predicted Rossmann fold nucleotide-binding protein DprA/Smf involved in DNA uptake
MIDQRERGVLLLCSTLGDEHSRPLTMAQFRSLSLRVSALGMAEGDPLAALTVRDLRRLDLSEQEAVRIVALLDRETQLDRYLARAEQQNIYPVTRLSPRYPARLWKQLGLDCPPVLFCHGDSAIFDRAGVALVGSRKLEATGRAFAQRVGRLAAEEHLTLISGGAAGADTAAQNACLTHGGCVLSFVADALWSRAAEARPDLLLVSEQGYGEPFSIPRAYSRNRLIHAMGHAALVAQSDYGTGGTWNGTLENLKKGWSPVFVCDDGSRGTAGLVERGATPLPTDGPQNLRNLQPKSAQLSLFG